MKNLNQVAQIIIATATAIAIISDSALKWRKHLDKDKEKEKVATLPATPNSGEGLTLNPTPHKGTTMSLTLKAALFALFIAITALPTWLYIIPAVALFTDLYTNSKEE